MYSQSTLVHANKQDRGEQLGKWQSWRRVKMTMVSQETDWIWAFWAFFSQGKGVKSRLQCWGCMCPAPGADTKNMGHSHSFCLLHTHTLAFSLFTSLFFLPSSLYLQLSSQERNSLFLEVNAHTGVLFDTTQEGCRQSPFVEIPIS